MSACVQQPGGIGLENAGDLASHSAKHGQLFFLAAGGMSRIVEAPMVAVFLSTINSQPSTLPQQPASRVQMQSGTAVSAPRIVASG